jgi:hypothetical protein
VLFVLAAAWFAWSARRHPGREETVRTREPDTDPDAESDTEHEDRSDAGSDSGSDADREQSTGPTA